MQSWTLLGRRNSAPIFGLWRCSGDRASHRSMAVTGGGQDHYTVLGIPRTSSAADVKRAYRLLARKYHPDVSREVRAGEVFKSIRLAYEVLSDEVTRSQYDIALEFPVTTYGPQRGRWENYEPDDRRQTHHIREKLRHWKQYYRKQQNRKGTSWQYEQSSSTEGGSFVEVLRFSLLAVIFVQMVGHRVALTFCGLAALFDGRLDAGYKMGYVIAWLLGGGGGVLLALSIYGTSRLYGKKNSGLVAVVVLAMWVGGHFAKFAHIPHGALLALLYMSIKFQLDLK